MQLSPRGEAQSAVLTNLSTSGLACQFSEAMTEMTIVAIDLDLPDHGTARVQGAVVRCDKIPDKSPATYEIGIFFTDMADETRRLLETFIESALTAQA